RRVLCSVFVRSVVAKEPGFPFDDDEFRVKKKAKEEKEKSGAMAQCSRRSKPSGGKQKSRSRYDDALRNFLPMGPAPKSPEDDRPNVKVIPNGSVSVFSYLWANWLSATMWKAWKTGLSPDDLWDLRGADKSEATAKRLRAAWDAELKKKGPQEASLFSACLRAMRTRLLVSVVFMMISTVFQFLAPTWVVKSLLDFVASNGNADAAERLPLSWGLTLVALLACCLLARNVTQNAMLAVGAHTGARVIGGLQVLAYERVLSWRTAAGDSDLLVGQLTNFCANDMDRVLEAVYLAPMIMSVPVMFVACMAYAIHIMGAWVLLGIFTIFLFYPLMSGLAAFVSRSRQVTARLTDKRISLVGELCAHIRLVKIYAWEQYLKERINDLRKPEQKAQEKAAFLQSITMTLTGSVAILAAVVTFLAYSLAGNELDAAAVFTVFSIFGAFQFSLGILPQTVRVIAEAAVALRRLKKLILFDPPEIGAAGLSHDPCNAIELEKASFVWDTENWESVDETPVKKKNKKKKAARGRRNKKVENGTVNQKLEEEEQVELNTSVPEDKKIKENLVLKDINLVVPRQGLVGLCGPVGCGKSSLIAAISGNLREVKSENCRRISGRIAVVSQTPWIFNATLRENVLFGLDYDAERYERVLEACCLQRDVDSLPNGDETEIGERGVNLSGGQKQRVNLARAVYADRDIYLLDDCLSAVDPEVSRDIFALCIRGLLKGKAVLLASHSLQLLEECGYVYYLEGGRIASEGLYEDLVADTEGRFMSLVKYDRTRGLKGGAESRRAATGGGGERRSMLREVKSENCRRISGRIAVVSQTPWIFNATLRENVLFGLDYDAERYERVLEACCLQRDVDSLPNGDETEIGERGVNLSGGQKQRVNLARAVYADRDIYLLDDCLSAVDPEVSRDIFALCIRGLLKGKAVLLASHSLQLLEECGYVYYLEGGRIASEGLYEDLVADTEGRFMSLVKYDRTRGLKGGAESRRAATGGGGGEADAGDSIHRDRTGGQLIGEETSATGGVTMNTYWSYYRRWGNVCAATLCMIVVLAYCLARIVIPRWLQLWIDDSAIGGEDGQTLEEDTHIYRIVLTALAANVILVGLAQGYVMCRQLLVASSKLHEEMLNSIIRAPMSFFDSTPTGRIMNRFSRDVDELDVRMPFLCSMVTQGILNVFLQLVAICFDYAYFTAPFCVILDSSSSSDGLLNNLNFSAVLFLAFDYWLNVGVREVKRVDNVTRSVIIQHIDMTVSGLSVIHSYEKETEFMDK
ncbi:unnamed protein product, partial [Notodromas monacha]